MFFHNPFSALSAHVPALAMRIYLLMMVILVIGGTLLDMAHKRNAAYFFASRRKTRARSNRRVSLGESMSIALKTAAVDVLASGEFCIQRRRIAHLLGMYGFIIYAIATVVMVFCFSPPGESAPRLVPLLWHLGALMVCIGGYWFWFFIRVDVVAEGLSPFRVMQADLFVIALVASTTFALVWSWLQWAASPLAFWALGLYLVATTVLFGSVAWSKFSHMFYKPAAAFQRRLEEASGSRRNLPLPAVSPAALGDDRELPRHY